MNKKLPIIKKNKKQSSSDSSSDAKKNKQQAKIAASAIKIKTNLADSAFVMITKATKDLSETFNRNFTLEEKINATRKANADAEKAGLKLNKAQVKRRRNQILGENKEKSRLAELEKKILEQRLAGNEEVAKSLEKAVNNYEQSKIRLAERQAALEEADQKKRDETEAKVRDKLAIRDASTGSLLLKTLGPIGGVLAGAGEAFSSIKNKFAVAKELGARALSLIPGVKRKSKEDLIADSLKTLEKNSNKQVAGDQKSARSAREKNAEGIGAASVVANNGGDKSGSGKKGKLGGIFGAIASGGKGIGKGIKGLLGGLGKGAGNLVAGLLTGIAKGISAFAFPKVLLGAAILAGSMILLAGGVAVSVKLLSLAAPALAEALAILQPQMQTYSDMNGTGLILTSLGILALGISLAAFAAGAATSKVVTYLTGDMDIVVANIQAFSVINGAALSETGAGIKALGVGLLSFGKGSGFSSVVSGLQSFFGADPAAQFKGFASISSPLKVASDAISSLVNSLKDLEDLNINSSVSKLKRIASVGSDIGSKLNTASFAATTATNSAASQVINNNNIIGGGGGQKSSPPARRNSEPSGEVNTRILFARSLF